MRTVIEASTSSDNLEDVLLSKFKNLSSKDKKYIMSYNDLDIDIEERKEKEALIDVLDEGRKRDGSYWTEEEVMHLIDTNDKVLINAIIHFWKAQNPKVNSWYNIEKKNPYSYPLESMCKWVVGVTNNGEDLKGKDDEEYEWILSPKQKSYMRKLLKRYKKQLTALANS